jgi:hypothetical protein
MKYVIMSNANNEYLSKLDNSDDAFTDDIGFAVVFDSYAEAENEAMVSQK